MPGRRETAELVGALQSSKKDALIDTLRTTLDQARGELERSRARAEAARATEAALRDAGVKEVRLLNSRCLFSPFPEPSRQIPPARPTR